MRLKVEAGPHTYINTPLSCAIPGNGIALGEGSLVDKNGKLIPCQICLEDGANTVVWIEPDLVPGDVKTYTLEPTSACSETCVEISDSETGGGCLVVLMNGELFTKYNYSLEYPRPFLYPFKSHDGAQVTRSFPMRSDVPDEDTDHKHHRSVWIAYGEVNGTDNWCENDNHGWIRHQAFEEITSGPVFGRVRSVNLWTSRDGTPQMSDVREFTFYNVPGERMMDVSVSFNATEADVLLGDTKEGGILSVRVASSMDGTRAGMIVNSYGGKTEAETWGRPAQWVDYYGPVGGKTYGITIMDHPSSFRFPARWHVRNYGLFTANPFALKSYEPGRDWTGNHTIKKGDHLDFRYRILVHEGSTGEAHIPERYFGFAVPPSVHLEQ